MRNWWKYLTVILLLYTIVFALYTPLKPGISGTSVQTLKTHTNNDVTLYGYNTDFEKFTSGKKWKVFIQIDGFKSYSTNIEIKSKKEIRFNLDLPSNVSNKLAHLIVEYEEGHLVLPNAFNIVTEENFVTDTLKKNENELVGLENVNVFGFPNRAILNESIRNLMFHVPMWFAMMLLFTISIVYSVKYLSSFHLNHDIIAKQAINVGILLGILGLATGSLWARFTWGNWWTNDVKLNGAAITTLVYLAYAVLRGSINEEQQRAKISAVYNIFAFVIMIVMLMVLPRMTDSLHPGSGGNPAFSSYDLDSTLRMVFYPAVLGWMGISLWLLQIRTRIDKIENSLL